MIKNRSKEITFGIIFVLVISFAAFYLDDEKISVPSGVTGFASYEEYSMSKDSVIVSGIEFKAVVDGKEYDYIFSDEGKWYESKKEFEWELRRDMGNTLWSGLYYLESYNAKVYYKDELVKDIASFARGFR